MKDYFVVPPSTGVFADLDNDTRMLEVEYGIPPQMNEPSFTKRDSFHYPAWARLNVLHRIWSCAEAMHGGSDCNRQAGAVKAWVRKKACTCPVGGKNEFGHTTRPLCDYARISDFSFQPVTEGTV